MKVAVKHWQVIPIREFSSMSVIKEEGGEVVATAQNGYAEAIQALPELVAASWEILENLKVRYPKWQPESSLGRLEQVIARLRLSRCVDIS
jgi:hypothetical protein